MLRGLARVRLRPLVIEDLGLMEPWFGEAAAVAHQLDEPAQIETLRNQILASATGGDDVLAIVASGDAPIGYIDHLYDEPAEGWLTIVVIAVAAGKRGFGYGAEAVRLLEARTSARRFLANVHPKNGLSLYFWLRMGYRPARVEEVFWRAWGEGGTIAMTRDAR